MRAELMGSEAGIPGGWLVLAYIPLLGVPFQTSQTRRATWRHSAGSEVDHGPQPGPGQGPREGPERGRDPEQGGVAYLFSGGGSIRAVSLPPCAESQK